MKQIIKLPEPESFVKWKEENPGADYNKLKGDEKQELKEALIKEQKHICCYCECRIIAEESHIEHFKPKDQTRFPELQLAYENLHASCIIRPTHDEDEHCGHRKGNYYSDDLIDPSEENCDSYFAYALDGEIKSRQPDDKRATETIRKLHLDSTLLNKKRKSLIDYFLYDLGDDLELLDAELEFHLDENKDELGEFFTMISYLKNNQKF